MRDALIDSRAASPAGAQDRYPAGAIIVCVSCARPLYRLERGLGLGEKAGRFVEAFAPVRIADLRELLERPDVDAGVRAHIRDLADLRTYIDRIVRPTTGAPALCPFCDQVFVYARTAETSDTLDRAYVWELHAIPPAGHVVPLKGPRWPRA